MEKELGVPKPGDLFIGVVDFFAVLVPGIIAAALIVRTVGVKPRSDILFISELIIAGWILGHVLQGIGSCLDPLLYDRLFRPRDKGINHKLFQNPNRSRGWIHFRARIRPRGWVRFCRSYFHKNDELYQLAKQMTVVPQRQNRQTANFSVPGGMYQWARVWLDSHSPEATANLDRLEADSKLFRSLAVLFLIGILILIAKPALIEISGHCEVPAYSRLTLIAVAFAGVLFSLWRYCDVRNKMIRRCYLHYVQLRFESRGGQETLDYESLTNSP